VAPLPKAVVAWSSGKDCAWALHRVRTERRAEVVGLLTTVTGTFDRVSMHGVRAEVLSAQARALGLPVRAVSIPYPCPNEVYAAAMGTAMESLAQEGVSEVVFGDLFLEDVRAYRERQMAGTALTPVFPLWGSDTGRLAKEMIAGGLRATVVCLDPKRLPRALAGHPFDEPFLRQLPPDVDPCGERGEFHTCVYAGPMFRAPLPIETGEVVTRDGFTFADFTMPATEQVGV
jgi:uncharacterized protein (TIGR00290 family)